MTRSLSLKDETTLLYGLYDTEGILRYIGENPEDCLEYAALFDLKTVEYCLIPLVGQKSHNEKLLIR